MVLKCFTVIILWFSSQGFDEEGSGDAVTSTTAQSDLDSSKVTGVSFEIISTNNANISV